MARYLFEYDTGVSQSAESARQEQGKETLFFEADNMEDARRKARVYRTKNSVAKSTGQLYELRPIAF